MKLIAIILSVLVVKLSVLPCCLDAGQEESIEIKADCCQQSSNSDQGESSSDSKACSPFFSCCSGAGFVFVKPKLALNEQALTEVKQGFSYLNIYSFVWHSSVFQPPQIIT